jgi:hypothetical protein
MSGTELGSSRTPPQALGTASPIQGELAERCRLSHRLGRFKSSAYKYYIFYIYCIDFVLLQAERESGEPRVDAGSKQL